MSLLAYISDKKKYTGAGGGGGGGLNVVYFRMLLPGNRIRGISALPPRILLNYKQRLLSWLVLNYSRRRGLGGPNGGKKTHAVMMYEDCIGMKGNKH